MRPWSTASRSAVNPAATGTKVAAHYDLTIAAGRSRDGHAPPRQGRAAGADSPTPTAIFATRIARGRRRSTHARQRHAQRRRARSSSARRSPGCIWCKQFYHYDVAEWLDGDPAHAAAAARTHATAATRLARAQQRRRPVDARHVGVPVVRGLGPGLPLPAAGADRPGVRQGPAPPADPRVVHAPERPAPGLRVGLLRRQPAGPRLGRLARLQDRPADQRRRRPRLPRAGLPQAAAQLHLVGQPQGQPTATTSSRAASSASTTSASSTAARRCRSPGTSARPTAPPGWGCTR